MVLTVLVVAAEVRLQRKQLPGSAHERTLARRPSTRNMRWTNLHTAA